MFLQLSMLIGFTTAAAAAVPSFSPITVPALRGVIAAAVGEDEPDSPASFSSDLLAADFIPLLARSIAGALQEPEFVEDEEMCAFFANDLRKAEYLAYLFVQMDPDSVFVPLLNQSGPIPPHVTESLSVVSVDRFVHPSGGLPGQYLPVPGAGFAAPCNRFTTTAAVRLHSILAALEAPTWTPALRRTVDVALHNLAVEAGYWVPKEIPQAEKHWMGLLIQTHLRVSVFFAGKDFDDDTWARFVRVTSFAVGRLANAAARCVDPVPLDMDGFIATVFVATLHPGIIHFNDAKTPEDVETAWQAVWHSVHRSVAPLLLTTLHSELRTQRDWTRARAILRELTEIADGPRTDAPLIEIVNRVVTFTHEFVMEYAVFSKYWTRGTAGGSATDTHSGYAADADEGLYGGYRDDSDYDSEE